MQSKLKVSAGFFYSCLLLGLARIAWAQPGEAPTHPLDALTSAEIQTVVRVLDVSGRLSGAACGPWQRNASARKACWHAT